MDPQMLLEVVRHNSVLVGGHHAALPATTLQGDSLEGPAGCVRPAMWQGTSGPPGKPTGSVVLPEGPAMASVGP